MTQITTNQLYIVLKEEDLSIITKFPQYSYTSIIEAGATATSLSKIYNTRYIVKTHDELLKIIMKNTLG